VTGCLSFYQTARLPLHRCYLCTKLTKLTILQHLYSETCEEQPCEMRTCILWNKNTSFGPKLLFSVLIALWSEDTSDSSDTCIRNTSGSSQGCPYFTGFTITVQWTARQITPSVGRSSLLVMEWRYVNSEVILYKRVLRNDRPKIRPIHLDWAFALALTLRDREVRHWNLAGSVIWMNQAMRPLQQQHWPLTYCNSYGCMQKSGLTESGLS
jgi:hypothetical protein